MNQKRQTNPNQTKTDRGKRKKETLMKNKQQNKKKKQTPKHLSSQIANALPKNKKQWFLLEAAWGSPMFKNENNSYYSLKHCRYYTLPCAALFLFDFFTRTKRTPHEFKSFSVSPCHDTSAEQQPQAALQCWGLNRPKEFVYMLCTGIYTVHLKHATTYGDVEYVQTPSPRLDVFDTKWKEHRNVHNLSVLIPALPVSFLEVWSEKLATHLKS